MFIKTTIKKSTRTTINGVFSYLCLCNKLPPKLSGLKNIYYVIVSVGMVCLIGSSGSRSLTSCNQGVSRTAVISRCDWGRIRFQAHSHGCWQDSVPCRLLDWGPQFPSRCWLEATLRFLSCGALHRAAHEMAACFIRVIKQEEPEREKESANNIEVAVFYNLNLEVTSHHFCYSLFVRSKSFGPAHTQGVGENYTRVWIPRGRNHWEPL